MKSIKTKTYSNCIVSALLIITILSCEKMDEEAGASLPTEEELQAFNNEVKNLSLFDQPEEISAPEILEEEAPARDTEEESLECYTTYYKAAPGFDELLAMDPTTDVIYPGALLKGETITTGEYVPVITDRTNITLSASLQNIEGSPVVEVENPKLSSVRDGVKLILDQKVTGATPAQINYEIVDVYSEEQLNLAIGANYRSAITKVSSSFDFTKSTYSHRFVLKFLQVYYTIDMDLPAKPGDLFTDLPDISTLGSTSPVYVSTVTYGRMILYTIESNYTKTEIKAAFDASFASGGGSIDAKHEKTIDESNIKALIIGGSGSSGSQTVTGPEQVYEHISEGGNYSKDSPGAPLSYKLRYLKDNSVARVVLSTEYFVRQCDLAYPVFYIELSSLKCTGCHDGDGSAGELYGSIYGRLSVGGKNVGSEVKWSYSSSNYYSLGKNATKTVGTSVHTEVYRPDYSTDQVVLSGSLKESDTWPDADENFGSVARKVLLKDITFADAIFELDFGEVKAGFNIKRLK